MNLDTMNYVLEGIAAGATLLLAVGVWGMYITNRQDAKDREYEAFRLLRAVQEMEKAEPADAESPAAPVSVYVAGPQDRAQGATAIVEDDEQRDVGPEDFATIFEEMYEEEGMGGFFDLADTLSEEEFKAYQAYALRRTRGQEGED